MEWEEFKACVASSIEGADAESLREDTDFKQLKAWDSLALLTLTDSIDMEYEVVLKKADIDACADVGALFELVQSKRANGA